MAEDAPATDARSALLAIDRRMVELWREGAWFLAGWMLERNELVVAMAPIADLPELAGSEPALLRGDPMDASALFKVAKRAKLRVETITACGWWTTAELKSALTQGFNRYAIRR